MNDDAVTATETPISDQNEVGVGQSHKASLMLSAGGVLGALISSSCCVLPLVLVSVGITGSWMSALTALEPYRPIFLTLTACLLGAGFYLVYRRPKTANCTVADGCGTPRSRRISESVLWVGTVLMAIGIGFPYAAPMFY